MSKLIKIGVMAIIITGISIFSISSFASASNYVDPENPGIGPAPSAGDGISDGPEWDIPIPNGPRG